MLSWSLAALLFARGAQADTPACAALPAPDRARAQGILEEAWLHDCCDQTLALCLEETPRCLLADRMADNVCRRVARDEPDDVILHALRLRAWNALPPVAPARHDLAGAPVAGAPDAPVKVVVYAAPRGVHCARLMPGLYEAVTRGPLQGKVELYVRLFPLRSNPFDKEAGLALLAAHQQGRFWDLALDGYVHFSTFTLENQRSQAQALGLEMGAFDRAVADPALATALSASKKEGLDNGVDGTPTFFVDGRLYRGELEVDELVDALEERWEQVTGRTRVGDAP